MYENLSEKKFIIHTLGCKVNQYESDAMSEALKSYGAIPADENDTLDFCIINTCSVTNVADRKSRQMIHKFKKSNPDSIVIATGCYVQAASESLLSDDCCDIIIGNNRKKDIARIISEYFDNGTVSDSFIDINSPCEYEETNIAAVFEHTRAYIKIQDGCNNFCTYCIIPYARGRIRSKAYSSVINEIETLAKNGTKEIVLTGINLSSYESDGHSLLDVICDVAEIPGIERVRLGSLEPRIITPEFLDRISKNPRICPHFHLSLQSACNKTLKNMNRHYTIEEYIEKCELIRKYYDRPALTTDIIVGFPDETEEDFNITYDNLVKLNLYEMHVFKYSRRKGTIADKMKNQINDKIKTLRSEKLIELRNKNQAAYEASFKGETVSILVEEIVEIENEKYFRGHTERYILCDVSLKDFFRDDYEVAMKSNFRNPESFINTIISTVY